MRPEAIGARTASASARRAVATVAAIIVIPEGRGEIITKGHVDGPPSFSLPDFKKGT